MLEELLAAGHSGAEYDAGSSGSVKATSLVSGFVGWIRIPKSRRSWTIANRRRNCVFDRSDPALPGG